MGQPHAARNDAATADARLFDLKLCIQRKLHFRFQSLWNREGAEKRAFESLTRRVGGTAVIEARIAGPVYWRADSGSSRVRVTVWPASTLGPELDFSWIRWPVENEGLLRSLEIIAPKGSPGPDIQERLRDLKESILAASANAMADSCGVNLARAWRGASEANPLVELDIAHANRAASTLKRLARGVRRVAFKGVLLEALDSEIEIEIHLPPLARARSRKWPVSMQGHRAVAGCGLVRVEKENARDLPATQATLAALWSARRDLPVQRLMSFEHTQRMTARQADFALPFLLKRYGMEKWGQDWLTGRKGDVQVRVQTWVPANAAAAWARMPGEKEAAFYDVFIRACKTIHEVLRQWSPYIYFRESSRFDDLPTSQAALAFSQSRTIRDRDARSLFTYDLLDPDHMAKALRRTAKPLTALFADVRGRLLADGRKAMARKYSWRSTKESVRQMRELANRPFGLILHSQSQVTHAFMALAVRGSKLQQNPRDACVCGAALAATLDKRLRRMFVQDSMSVLAPLLIAEVTRTLSTAQGYPAAMDVVVRLSGMGGAETIAEGKITGAEWPLTPNRQYQPALPTVLAPIGSSAAL